MCFLGRENYEMALHIPGGVKWSSWADAEAATSISQVLVSEVVSDGSSPQDIEIEFGNTADDSETQFTQSSTSLQVTQPPTTQAQAQSQSQSQGTAVGDISSTQPPATTTTPRTLPTQPPTTTTTRTLSTQQAHRTASSQRSRRGRHGPTPTEEERDAFEERVRYLRSIPNARRSPSELAELRPYLTLELLERLLAQNSVPLPVASFV